MLLMVDDGIPMHYIIYSMEVLKSKHIQKVIMEQTGFDVKIEG